MDNKRLEEKKSQILNALKISGRSGVTNAELSNIALRYGAYLGDLYREGYKVSKEHLGNGLYNYVLISEPSEVVVKEKAVDVLASAIEALGVSKESFLQALENSNVSVRYKANTYNN